MKVAFPVAKRFPYQQKNSFTPINVLRAHNCKLNVSSSMLRRRLNIKIIFFVPLLDVLVELAKEQLGFFDAHA